jgi:fructose-1,6-bisphosphatase/inositol monophosphatase family enzyme
MRMSRPVSLEPLRAALLALQNVIRDAVLAARRSSSSEKLSAISEVTASDTIYAIDKISEETIIHWFSVNWPKEEPVELVMEGAEGLGPLTFPIGTPALQARWKCIMDPIDGTRNIMYDKRSAWVLAGLAPQRGPDTRLSDIVIAAMTELPTTNQWRSDQISAIAGAGFDGIRAESLNLFTEKREDLLFRPSKATDFRHGFASLARFFPEGKTLTARIEERLWEELHGTGRSNSPLVFDDQYISTGGQLYELLVGHDRMLGDLRPLVFAKLGITSSLVCHPYDACTELILREAGGVVEKPDGSPLDAPLDTVSPVAWIGFANETLARQVRPVLRRILEEVLA